MKLTNEERQIVVSLQIEKAHRFLEQADEMCRQKYWDIASNRYYYACYHAVQALLIKNELVAHTHNGLLTQFGLHFSTRFFFWKKAQEFFHPFCL